jgi:hypothetical protein
MTPPDPALLDDAALERRVLARVWLLAIVFLAGVAIINSLTQLTEAERAGVPYDPRVPWILEVSSVLMLFLLVPLVALFERRFPLTPDTWRTALLWHVLGSVGFSALHVLGMWALRSVTYALWLGRDYVFFDNVVTDALYEYRKDLLPYAVIVLLLSLTRGLEEHRREAAVARSEARETGRLTLKTGGRTLYLDARSLDWASAAGNYVEIRANGASHLARISLSALEQQLGDAGVEVARVHRSHIVNLAKVREVAPARDGDFRILMADGAELRGSRRFRHTLPA